MSQSPGAIPGVKKIAVLRANAIGDFVFALPALISLRAAYPRAEITLLGKTWHKEFLCDRPGPVDRVLAVPPIQGVSQPDTWTPPEGSEQAEVQVFFRNMLAEQFDLALQMHGGGGYSNPFVLQLGARLTAGLKSPQAPALDRWAPYIYWQHEVMRLLEVAMLVGAPPAVFEPKLEVTLKDLEESTAVLPGSYHPLIVLHPGASDPRRRWPAHNFARLGDDLQQSGCHVVIVGGSEELGLAETVRRQMERPANQLAGKLSLAGLTGLLARADLVIANDSGPLHLAQAVGTPTVGLFWCGNLINAGPPFRRLHRAQLSWRLDCPVCGKNTIHESCTHNESFLDMIQVDEVLSSATEILTIRRAETGLLDAGPHD